MMTHRNIGTTAAAALVAGAAIAVGCSDNPASPSVQNYKGPEIAVGAGHDAATGNYRVELNGFVTHD